MPVSLSQCPCTARSTKPEAPQDCGRRPWDAARGRWEEPASQPGSAAWRGASLRRVRGGPGWGPRKGSRAGSREKVLDLGPKQGPGRVPGSERGSVDPGRAAQDEGGILASLRASIASAGPGPREQAGKGRLGRPPSYRQIWMADGVSVPGSDISATAEDGGS